MPKIKQLSPHESQKIAAGEVVERPANIVKELIENSIDAGATKISIYVEDGGKELIRIVDNGCGMDITDAQICFDRHATSKITSVDQLDSVNTFGFRGEALASIASVSHITLITKEETSLEGTRVILEADNIINTHAVACTTGTDISIRNLFFNVPARKKFLKATQTEWRAIQTLFNAFCFDYPSIHFALYADGKQTDNCPATISIKNRALQVWEPSLHNHVLELSITGTIAIEGIISDHQYYRYDRNNISFFVNKRWVKNQHLSSAFIKGYANVIPHGRYPVAAINITLPTNEVDINIHPRKEEVKFLHPRRVEQLLQDAVKKALEQNLSQHLKKEVTFKATPPSYYQAPAHNFKPFDFDTFFTKNSSSQQTVMHSSAPSMVQSAHNTMITNGQPIEPSIDSSETVTTILQDDNQTLDNQTSYRLIGQYNATYILIEREEGLFLVDQHAAHERILYELFSQRFNEVATVQLMFPHIITLLPHEIDSILPYLDIFTANGMLIEQCANNQLTVQSLPVHLKDQSMYDLIKQTIEWITQDLTVDQDTLKKTIHHKLQAQMACKAAVKAGDLLTHEKMEQLLHDLHKTANRFSCPHGRPTGWLLSLSEIEKKFKRRT